jgi:hypothetical protein
MPTVSKLIFRLLLPCCIVGWLMVACTYGSSTPATNQNSAVTFSEKPGQIVSAKVGPSAGDESESDTSQKVAVVKAACDHVRGGWNQGEERCNCINKFGQEVNWWSADAILRECLPAEKL